MTTPALGARSAFGLLLLSLLAPSARAQSTLFTDFGRQAGDSLGASMAAAGDVDGDTVPDLIVGAPAAIGSASAPGYARVLSGADGSLIHRLDTTGEADLFGWSVAGVGDTNDDGVPDLLVGEPGSVPGPGEARLFSGLTGALLREFNGGSSDSWDGFGFSVAAAGDLDADGNGDFLIGIPSLSGEEPGRVRVVSGFDGGVLFLLTGLGSGDAFGASVASAGLIDADAVPDVIVGAGQGAYARVYSGATGALLHHFAGPASGYGRCVTGIGDLDGDGTDDVAIGAPNFNSVDVMSGATGALLRRYETLSEGFGASITPLGDVDDDDVPDLLIGAPDSSLLDVETCGTAVILSGDTGSQLFKFFGHDTNERLGAATARLGDTDGDGLPELLVGAPGDSAPSNGNVGSVKAFDGKLAGSLVPYGFGCPNSFLITPVLELLGDPTPGGQLILSLTRGAPALTAVIFVGGGPGLVPLSNGCILWVAPVLPATLILPIKGGFPGIATVFGQVPPAVPAGAVITFQAFTPEPDAAGGFATSGAVQLTVQ